MKSSSSSSSSSSSYSSNKLEKIGHRKNRESITFDDLGSYDLKSNPNIFTLDFNSKKNELKTNQIN